MQSEPSPAFLLEVIQHLALPVFVKDRAHRWVYLNDAFCRLTGFDKADMIGKTDHDFFPKEQADSFHAADARVFAGEGLVDIPEEPITDASGLKHVLQTTKAPVRDAAGNVTHLIGVIHDVTRTKAAEDALRQANEELEQRVEERTDALRGAQQALLRKERLTVLGQLAGGLAHQIRNPLAAIANACAVLDRRLGASPDPDVQQAVAVIREEVWEANRIITDLLDYARVRPPSLMAVSAAQLVDAALEASRPDNGIEVVCDVDPELLIRVDERQTRDALANVMRNAFEAMSGRGTLTVRAHVESEFAVIAVEDTGPGLTRASLAGLFEPLVTSKPLGLGLGLATARALIENQGGTIRCATVQGHGARFEIRVQRGYNLDAAG